MSHIVSIRSQIRDAVAIGAACRRLGLAEPVHGTAELYGGSVQGLLVQLPGWQYPIAIDTASGEVKADNFDGHWGEMSHFEHFQQMYAVEKCRLEARRKGLTVSEIALPDGSVKLQLLEGS